CVIPRTMHHLKALRTPPPKTPARLERLPGFTSTTLPELVEGNASTSSASGVSASGVSASDAIESARTLLRKSGYRVRIFEGVSTGSTSEMSVSAERGYLRETGNLVFHTALIGV